MVIDQRGEGRKMSEKEKKRIVRKRKEEEAEGVNRGIELLNKVNDALANKFLDGFEGYVKEKKDGFEKELERFCRENIDIMKDANLTRKLPTLKLSEYLCKPFITNAIRLDGRKYNATHLLMASDYYWECVMDIQSKGLTYVPTIQQFARLLNISVQTLRNTYLNSSDEDLRETITMIRDRFVDYYTTRGMTREISEVMSIFMLKAEYNIRDNDVPQTVINNNTISIDSGMLEKLRKEENSIETGNGKLLSEV